jgi:hypothetical protein
MRRRIAQAHCTAIHTGQPPEPARSASHQGLPWLAAALCAGPTPENRRRRATNTSQRRSACKKQDTHLVYKRGGGLSRVRIQQGPLLTVTDGILAPLVGRAVCSAVLCARHARFSKLGQPRQPLAGSPSSGFGSKRSLCLSRGIVVGAHTFISRPAFRALPSRLGRGCVLYLIPGHSPALLAHLNPGAARAWEFATS